MSTDLVRECINHTHRTYPDGYGFALTYLDGKNLNPVHLRDCANRIVSGTFHAPRYITRRDPDLVRYVAAQQNAGWHNWLIEAAQLVHTAALAGDKEAGKVLGLCGHPGFSA